VKSIDGFGTANRD